MVVFIASLSFLASSIFIVTHDICASWVMPHFSQHMPRFADKVISASILASIAMVDSRGELVVIAFYLSRWMVCMGCKFKTLLLTGLGRGSSVVCAEFNTTKSGSWTLLVLAVSSCCSAASTLVPVE